MIFGSRSSPFSSQYVKNTHALQFKDRFPRALQGIIDWTYVDDYVDSFDTEEEAVRVTAQVTEVHAGDNFE